MGTSLRTLEKLFKISRQNLSRHSLSHIPGGIPKNAKPGAKTEVEPVPAIVIEAAEKELARTEAAINGIDLEDASALQNINWVMRDIRKLIEWATAKMLPTIRNAAHANFTKAAATKALLTGELRPASTQIGVQVNVSRERWADSDLNVLRWALARHVERTIGFTADAIEILRKLAAVPCPQCNRFGCPHDPS